MGGMHGGYKLVSVVLSTWCITKRPSRRVQTVTLALLPEQLWYSAYKFPPSLGHEN